MPRGSSMSEDNKDLLKNIGDRLKKQRQKNTDDKKNENTDYEEKKQDDKSKKANDKTKDKTEIKEDKNSYSSTYTVKPEMERIYMDTRFKFRNLFHSNLSRQDAIEIGLLLLNNLDNDLLEKISNEYSKEDDLIQILKKLIKEKNI